MTRRSDNSLSRRALVRALARAALMAPAAGGLSAALPLLVPRADAQSGTPRRFIQIFLLGGWDSALATDPILAGSAKALSGAYFPGYHQSAHAQYAGAPTTVAGKPALVLGPGLAPLASALAAAPAAFVNGMFVEVTAHELATNYVFSGVPSLSRSREFPAFVATMADRTGGFPAHVLLGGSMPLAATARTNPPLQSHDANTLVQMLAGPHGGDTDFRPASIDAAHDLLATLNAGFQARLSERERKSLRTWSGSEAGLPALYAKRYDQRLALSSQMRTDFLVTGNDSPGARIAMAFQVIKEGVSRYATAQVDGFDTHQNHLASHRPLQQSVATSLRALVDRLMTTPDPDAPSKKLIETTTVLVASEFVRTPAFNAAAGTDHWQSGSAVLIGRGVRDGAVVGSTDAQGNAEDLAAAGGKLLPEHVAASCLRMMGFAAEADALSEVHLDALFT